MKIFKKFIIIILIIIFFNLNNLSTIYAKMGTRLNDEQISEEDLLVLTKEIGALYNLNPYLLFAITEAESTRFIYSINYNGTCFGLTQISTYWHSDRMERLGVTDIYDPYGNLLCCADYVSELYTIYETTESVLMHYNMITSEADEMVAKGLVSEYASKIISRTSELEEIYGSIEVKNDNEDDIVTNRMISCSLNDDENEQIILFQEKNILFYQNINNYQTIKEYIYKHLLSIDTPTAKAMGFLFLRPLHCRKDFSFT